jgi:hypothetical protein
MKNEYITWVSVDELIEKLEKIKKDLGGDGTVPVCINSMSDLCVSSRPFYYDGGYFARSSENLNNVLPSRNKDRNGLSLGFNGNCIDISARLPEDNELLEGRLVMEIDPDNWDWLDKQQQEERAEFGGQLIKYRVQKEKDPIWNCYPFRAYLDSGEEAFGPCMKDAKDALRIVYKSVNNK